MFHPYHLSFWSLFIFQAFLEHCSVVVSCNKWHLRLTPYRFAFILFSNLLNFFELFLKKKKHSSCCQHPRERFASVSTGHLSWAMAGVALANVAHGTSYRFITFQPPEGRYCSSYQAYHCVAPPGGLVPWWSYLLLLLSLFSLVLSLAECCCRQHTHKDKLVLPLVWISHRTTTARHLPTTQSGFQKYLTKK